VSNILLIEDDEAIRSVIATNFRSAGFDVAEAATAANGLQLLRETSFDLALIDLRLPDSTGIEIIRTARPLVDIPLVILTAYSNTADVIEALEAGADDFLSKPIDLHELQARLRALLRRYGDRQRSASLENVTLGDLELRTDLGEAHVGSTRVPLTKTEFNVLYELLIANGALVSKATLLDRVWGYDYLGETRLVDTQIYRLRAKLIAAGMPDPISTVRGRGYRMNTDTAM
jgi:two-component system, OmpR family, response regulator MtrA